MENSSEAFDAQTKTGDEGKTIAIISYLTVLGWIIAYAMNGSDKTPLGTYHIRQTATLFIAGICTWFVQMLVSFIPIIGWIIGILMIFVYIGLFILWIIGLVAAINGQAKPIPVIGEKSQVWFKGIQ